MSLPRSLIAYSMIFALASVLNLAYSGKATAATSPSMLDFSLRPPSSTKGIYFRGGFFVAAVPEDYGQAGQGDMVVEYHHTVGSGLSLIWSPLPVGFLYRLRTDNGFESAVSWNLDFLGKTGFGIAPRFDSFTRKQLNERWACEIGFEYSAFLSSQSASNIWSGGLMLGFRYLATADISLTAGSQVTFNNNPLFVSFQDGGFKRLGRENELLYPLIFGLDATTRRGLKLGLEYQRRDLVQGDTLFSDAISFYLNRSW